MDHNQSSQIGVSCHNMASPFATIRTRSFRIQFDEPAHAYLFDGKRVEHSVSQLAASLKRPFDGLMVASRCSAQKREQWTNNPNCSDAALVAAWNQNGAMAAEAGTRLHAQIETSGTGSGGPFRQQTATKTRLALVSGHQVILCTVCSSRSTPGSFGCHMGLM
jgi:hypothetical protein